MDVSAYTIGSAAGSQELRDERVLTNAIRSEIVRVYKELGQRSIDPYSPAERQQVVYVRYQNDRLGYGCDRTHHGLEDCIAGLFSPPLRNTEESLPACAALWPLACGYASIIVSFFDKQHNQYEAYGGFNGVDDERPVPGQLGDHEGGEKRANKRGNDDRRLP